MKKGVDFHNLKAKKVTMLQKHGQHVFYIRTEDAPKSILETPQGTLQHFRGAIYLTAGIEPNDLSPTDICCINNLMDQKPGLKNTFVKKVFSNALDLHFKNQPYTLYEIGCGAHPITEHIKGTPDFHGIEIDSKIINTAQKKGLCVTHWKSALKTRKTDDRPKVCASIFSQHYLKSDSLIKRIKKLINEEGFYIGNTKTYYETEDTLKAQISHHGLRYIFSSNKSGAQYWCIFFPSAQRNAFNFWSCLEKAQKTNRKNFSELLDQRRETLSTVTTSPVP